MEDLNRTQDTISMSEIVFNGQTEQGVEFDYVLPDYYPDIFRILSCTLTPRIVSTGVTGGSKLMLDGIVYIKVLYMTEGSSAVYCVENRYTYSKSVEFGKKGMVCENPVISVIPATDYCNCRAVSNRRIDVRGAVSTKIRITCANEVKLPSLAEGLQIKTKDITCCGSELNAEKQYSLREEIETGASGISYIINCDATPKITDLRVIADKAVMKGTVTVNALYGIHDPQTSGCTNMEHMTADIPISQILDVDGISEEYTCMPDIAVMNCELICKEDSGILTCELQLMCKINAVKEETISIPIDAYSTEYETEHKTSMIKAAANPRKISEQLSLRTTMNGSSEIESIWDCRSELNNVICRMRSDKELVISGQLCCKALGKTNDGMPCYIEKQDAFEEVINISGASADCYTDCRAAVTDTGYSIKPDGTLDISAQVDCNILLKDILQLNVMSDISLLKDKPKSENSDFALRIFYANGEEDCWSIAKRYNTTVSAIVRDNEIEDHTAPLSGMVLIPTL